MPGQVFGRGFPVQPRFGGTPRFWHPGGEEFTVPLPTAEADASGRPSANRLFYAVNSARWWILWVAGDDDATLRSAWSTDLLTWTPGDTTGLNIGINSGFTIAAAYRSISATDVVHIGYGRRISATEHRTYHLRATVAAATITFEASAEIASAGTGNDGGVAFTDAIAVTFDSTNKVFQQSSNIGGAGVAGDPNTAISSNADAGSSWTAGFGASVQHESVAALNWSAANFDLGAGAVLALWDDGAANTTHNDIRWSKWTGTWSTPAAVFGSTSAQDADNWGAVARTATDIHAVRRLTSTTYEHRRFNGTAWSAGQAITAQANKDTAGTFVTSDGTDVYLAIIDSDAANTVRYTKWSSASSTWGAWTALEASTQVRTALSGARTAGAGLLGFCWTEAAGAGFQIVTKPLSLSTAAPAEATTATAGASDASAATGASPAEAAGTAAAPDAAASTAALPSEAAATGAAQTPTTAVTANADIAAGTATASAPTPDLQVNAEAAAATGTASDATVAASGSANAPAETTAGTATASDATAAIAAQTTEAAATGAAQTPSAAITASPTEAAGTAAALPAAADIAASAEPAAATAAAQTPTPGISPQPAEAAGTGSAPTSSTDIQANADTTTATGLASDATVSTATFTNAPADATAATGSAPDASAAITALAENAAGTGQASNPSIAITITLQEALATGAAYDASTTAPAAAPTVPAYYDNTSSSTTHNGATTTAGSTGGGTTAGSTGGTTTPTGILT